MTLEGFPLLLSKTQLSGIFGVSVSQINRRIADGEYKGFEWVDDCGKIKATRESVEAHLRKAAEGAAEKLATPPIK